MSFEGPERLPQISVAAKRNYGNAGYDIYFGKIWIREELAFDWANNDINLWSYVHGKSHETILLDTDSLLMTRKKAEILAQCHGRSLSRSLEKVNELINKITDQAGKTRSQVEDVIDAQLDAHLLALKPLRPLFYSTIDELMEAKLLVCRQKAMIAAALLAHLVKNGNLKGKVRLYRTVLEIEGKRAGAHAWTLFRDEATQHLWICDPRWEKVINVTLNKADADEYYGKVTIDNMIERADSQDILKPFKRAIAPFIGGISPIQKANLEKPSVEYPFEYLKLVLSDDLTQNFAIRQALRNCYVEYEKEVKAGVTSLILKASNNPLLAKLDIRKLKAEYERILEAESILKPFVKNMGSPLIEKSEIHEGSATFPDQHIRLHLKDSEYVKHLSMALEKHKVRFAKGLHGDQTFIVLYAKQNALFKGINPRHIIFNFTEAFVESLEPGNIKKIPNERRRF